LDGWPIYNDIYQMCFIISLYIYLNADQEVSIDARYSQKCLTECHSFTLAIQCIPQTTSWSI